MIHALCTCMYEPQLTRAVDQIGSNIEALLKARKQLRKHRWWFCTRSYTVFISWRPAILKQPSHAWPNYSVVFLDKTFKRLVLILFLTFPHLSILIIGKYDNATLCIVCFRSCFDRASYLAVLIVYVCLSRRRASS